MTVNTVFSIQLSCFAVYLRSDMSPFESYGIYSGTSYIGFLLIDTTKSLNQLLDIVITRVSITGQRCPVIET